MEIRWRPRVGQVFLTALPVCFAFYTLSWACSNLGKSSRTDDGCSTCPGGVATNENQVCSYFYDSLGNNVFCACNPNTDCMGGTNSANANIYKLTRTCVLGGCVGNSKFLSNATVQVKIETNCPPPPSG